MRRDQDMPLDPDVERELAAVDAGLVGLDVAPDLEDLADLAGNMRAEAPAPESDFAAKLDEWAAGGFPRDGRMSDGGEGERRPALGGLRERFRTTPPRRLLLPAGAAATVLVAVVVGISVSDQLGGSSPSGPTIQGQSASAPATAGTSAGGPGGAGGTSRAGQASDSIKQAPETNAPSAEDLQPTVLPGPRGRATGDLALQGGPHK